MPEIAVGHFWARNQTAKSFFRKEKLLWLFFRRSESAQLLRLALESRVDMASGTKTRVDLLLVERGLVSSRTRARR